MSRATSRWSLAPASALVGRAWQGLPTPWRAPAGCLLAGLLIGGAAGLLQTPTYRADTELYVASDQPGTDSTVQGTALHQRVRSYTALVTSPRVLDPVIRRLHLTGSAADLAPRVQASNPPDSLLIDLSVSDSSPARAREVAHELAAEFPGFVQQLEATGGNDRAPASITVVRAAQTPGSPSSPGPVTWLVSGVLIGTAAGAVVTLVLRTAAPGRPGRAPSAVPATPSPVPAAPSRPEGEQVTALIGSWVVGEIEESPAGAELIHPAHPLQEAFQRLRGNLRFGSAGQPVRSLLVIGAGPGDGASTVAANLALTVAWAADPVVLVDADLHGSRVAAAFGLPAGEGLAGVLAGRIALDAALTPWQAGLPLWLLAGPPVPIDPGGDRFSARALSGLVERLSASGGLVVLDAPAWTPDPDTAALVRAVDGVLLVAGASTTRIDQLVALVRTLREQQVPLLGVVLNRVPAPARALTIDLRDPERSQVTAYPSGTRSTPYRISVEDGRAPWPPASRPPAYPSSGPPSPPYLLP